ncbi:MAG TPA: aspartate--tRNA ligase [Candidatus Omnitrophota bacterium]|nr:aspartate--tRNA ligase [Candidatus Omnitrophota bacterium]
MTRTHNCAELSIGDSGKEVTLSGWVSSRRDHGEIIFVDLRDKHGVTQIVFDPARNRDTHLKAHDIRNEFCVKVRGRVAPRPEGTINKAISTGEIEVDVEDIEILSAAGTLPFEIKDGIQVSEDVRLRYRYLDLRRPSMQNKLKVRHKISKFIGDFLDGEGFISVETPMLTKSTPEGARDYIVPSRLQQGDFYALPQSPQIFKQLLMVAGVERYFQIVRCFRDEDLRADRQPEFTQIDMEMSFVEQDDILDICERMFKGLFSKVLGIEIETPFRRMDHAEAMSKYGSDKPDTRFDVLLSDITDEMASCGFKVFRSVISSGGRVMALAAPGYGSLSRKEIDELISFAGEYGAKGLAYLKVEENGLTSQISKFFTPEELKTIREKTSAVPGDMIFMVADDKDVAYQALGALRLKIGRDKGLIDRSRYDFLWVVNFPLFKFNKEEKRWVSEHHPFTSLAEEDMGFLDSGDLGKIRSKSYDLVLNGSEIGSGSIRIHNREVQNKIFSALGLTENECAEKFGFLLEAFSFGAPPHGGVAFGMDRLITLFTGDSSIREVIPFPKTQKGICPLTGAPSGVSEEQLRDLGIKIKKLRTTE